jgi:hypothetical protein
MIPTKLLLAAAAVTLAAAAAPGGASAATDPIEQLHNFVPTNPVPAGQVQHTITDTSMTRVGTGGPYTSATETWNATDSSHMVVSGPDGRTIYECGSHGMEWSCYYPDDDVYEHGNEDPLVNASWIDQGRFYAERAELKANWKRIGTATDIGRPATVYRQEMTVEDRGRNMPTTEVLDVDDATGFFLRDVMTEHETDGSTLMEQVTSVRVMEVITQPTTLALGLVPRGTPSAKYKAKMDARAKAKTKAKHKTKAKAKPKAKHKRKSTAKQRKAKHKKKSTAKR